MANQSRARMLPLLSILSLISHQLTITQIFLTIPIFQIIFRINVCNTKLIMEMLFPHHAPLSLPSLRRRQRRWSLQLQQLATWPCRSTVNIANTNTTSMDPQCRVHHPWLLSPPLPSLLPLRLLWPLLLLQLLLPPPNITSSVMLL